MRTQEWGLVALCAVLGLSGCKNTAGTGVTPPPGGSLPFSGTSSQARAPGVGTSADRDPLLGPLPSTSLPSRAPSPPPGATTSSGWNQSNPSFGSTSPAAMTTGNQGNGGLRIQGASNDPANGGITLPPIRLQQEGSSGFSPAPAPSPPPSSGLGAIPAGAAGGLATASFNSQGTDEYQAIPKELARKGVIFQRLEMTNANDWRFTCTVADRQNPSLRKNFDHRGKSDIEVMRAVLEEIDAPPPGF